MNPNESEYVFRHGRPLVDPSNSVESHEEAAKDLNESLEHFVQPPPMQVYKVACIDPYVDERTFLWVVASDAENAREVASMIVGHRRTPFNGALTPTRAIVLPNDYLLPDVDLHDLARGLEHLRPEEVDEDREDPGPM